MNDWLTDIYNLGNMPAKQAVCSVCKQNEHVDSDAFYPICNKCDTFDRFDSSGRTYAPGEEGALRGAIGGERGRVAAESARINVERIRREQASKHFPPTRGFNPQHTANPRMPESVVARQDYEKRLNFERYRSTPIRRKSLEHPSADFDDYYYQQGDTD